VLVVHCSTINGVIVVAVKADVVAIVVVVGGDLLKRNEMTRNLQESIRLLYLKCRFIN